MLRAANLSEAGKIFMQQFDKAKFNKVDISIPCIQSLFLHLST